MMNGSKTNSLNYLVIDVETTIKNDGDPSTKSNRLCTVCLKGPQDTGPLLYWIEYDSRPYGDSLAAIRNRCQEADVVVLFNGKFDLAWLERYEIHVTCPVWDSQLFEFLSSHQRETYPALADVAARRGLGSKLDVVRVEYWEKGIDTPDIPPDILEEYALWDVMLTEGVYLQQREELEGNRKMLFRLQCEDLKILLDMEMNGIPYDVERAKQLSVETRSKIEEIDAKLYRLADHPCVNFGSDQHLSCLLYGGTIWEKYREKYTRTLKDGTIKEKERWSERPVIFKQLVRPIARTEGTETKKLDEAELRQVNQKRSEEGKRPIERHWSVAEPVLRMLHPKGRAKELIGLILERAKLTKLDSTYYTGLLEKMREHEWDDNIIHGKFNQCVAVTSRLSSSDPNLQNFAGEIKELFVSRFS